MPNTPKTEDDTPPGYASIQSTLAIRVREARTKLKLRQHELGTLIGSSQSFIFVVEAAESNITLKTLARLAHALRVEPIDLLDENPALPIIDDAKTRELSTLVQNSIEEVRATTSDLAKVATLLQQAHDLLTSSNTPLKVRPAPDGEPNAE